MSGAVRPRQEDWAVTEENGERQPVVYSRREAVAALVRYSAAVGGVAVPILTADDAVAQASAYPPDFSDNPILQRFCERHPSHWICSLFGSGGGWRGQGNGRISF